jgi:hypothetical protein
MEIMPRLSIQMRKRQFVLRVIGTLENKERQLVGHTTIPAILEMVQLNWESMYVSSILNLKY